MRFQIPVNARPLPVLLWHGGTTSGSCWESTPDGRPGFETLLLGLGYSCYTMDQPRKGRGGAPAVATDSPYRAIPPDDRTSWTTWRLGIWEEGGEPVAFEGLQLPTDPVTIDQFLRRRTADSGPPVGEVVIRAISELLDLLGPTVVITHSNSAQWAWQLPMGHVAAIIAYEPGCFAFPVDALPEDVPSRLPDVSSITAPLPVSHEQFEALSQVPIHLVYGDNITDVPSENFGVELWRVNIRRAAQFVRALRAHDADVDFIRLPECGIRGNTHFPFTDLNHREIAALADDFLLQRGLG